MMVDVYLAKKNVEKNMQNLTDNEKTIIEILRSLNPFEEVIITADKQGKPNNFLIKRSRKAILTDTGVVYLSI